MDPKKIERLKALIAKDEKSLEAKEKTELASLQKEAKEAGLDPETGEKAKSDDGNNPDGDGDDPEGMTEDDVKCVVIDALKGIGLDEETVTAIKTKMDDSEGLKAEDIKNIVSEKIGGQTFDTDALVKAITDKVGKTKGISADELDKKLKDFAKDFKGPKRHEYGGDVVDFPVEHRSGNLTVAQKQLLNICLMGVSEEAIEVGKSVRPKHINDGISDELLRSAKASGARQVKALVGAVRGGKAVTTGGSGSGAELVNTDLSSDLQARLYLESQLATEMIGQEIQMPTSPFKLPISTTRPQFYVGSEGGTPTESSGGTGDITLTDKKLIGNADYSYESDEDAIVAILPMLQSNMGEAAAAALEGAIINGDASGTHQDADFAGVTNHHAKLFNGLRKYALDASLTSDLSGTGITASALAGMRKLMKKYGVRPRDLLIVAGVQGYNDLIQLDETLTADKVGNAAARILTGEAASLYGMRIVVSESVREDLNASGVQQGSVDTKGSIYILHRPSFLLGVRRGFLVEVDVDKKTQMNSVIASFRRAFQPKETPSSTISSVVAGINYDA